MKVGLSSGDKPQEATTGKRKFFGRLSAALSDLGVEITTKHPDVYLRLPGDKPCSKTNMNILRLDGLWLNKEQNYKKKNKGILNSIKRSDGVIYQGMFCFDAYRNFLGVDIDEYAIIPNGADPKEFLPRNPQDFFLAACRWRPHKRLKAITKAFLLALDTGLDADLVVAGEADYTVNHPRVKYVGWQSSAQLVELYSKAIASLHLTWLDWCPNAMVESLVAGCPVIYSDSGGHYELAVSCGQEIKDTEWDFKPCKLYHPPSLSLESVAMAMCHMKESPVVLRPGPSRLNINEIARRYLSFFKSAIENRRRGK